MNKIVRASKALRGSRFALEEEGNRVPAGGVDSVVEEDIAVAVDAEDVAVSLEVGRYIAGGYQVYMRVVGQLEIDRSVHVVKMAVRLADRDNAVGVEGTKAPVARQSCDSIRSPPCCVCV